ncbi:MAG: fibronectin type III domain-containing protein, partial [Planctomycetota bacterium]
MRKTPWQLLLLAAAFCAEATDAPAAEDDRKERRQTTRLFFRAVGAQNNAPILPKTRSVWTRDRQVRTGTTGMSDLGFTEYPFCSGQMDFCFLERYAYYPRLLSGAEADRRIVNTADMVLEHVYQPDGCVWGREGRRFLQTFTATRRELVSITLLVASEPGTFRAALIEGGPGGRQIGAAKTFVSGHSMTWGYARWNAGQAPLEPGGTYGIRIERSDGRVWMPYLHSTGNAYDGGLLYVDGVPYPESDLAVWILQEPADLRRALIQGADPDGWLYDGRRVAFVPRTPNVRLISLSVTPVTADELSRGYCDLVGRVYASDGRLIAGPKRCLAVGPKDGPHTAHFLFAAGECPVRPGERYLLDVYTVPHKQEDLPDDEDVAVLPRDVRARVYGEPQPGAMPGIYNLAVGYASDSGFRSDSRLRLSWSEPFPAPTRIETWGPGVNDGKRTDVPGGTTDVVIKKFWPGHEYDFRLTSTGPTGLRWSTPRYRI